MAIFLINLRLAVERFEQVGILLMCVLGVTGSKKIEDMHLLNLANARMDDESSDFEDFVKTTGFTMEELEELSESVNIE